MVIMVWDQVDGVTRVMLIGLLFGIVRDRGVVDSFNSLIAFDPCVVVVNDDGYEFVVIRGDG